jgi:hypothetical protein
VANKWRICYAEVEMAHRPETDAILSREDLIEFQRHLSMLSVPGVEGVYQTSYADCKYDGKRLPPAAAIQQLVAAWKVLRSMYKAK